MWEEGREKCGLKRSKKTRTFWMQSKYNGGGALHSAKMLKAVTLSVPANMKLPYREGASQHSLRDSRSGKDSTDGYLSQEVISTSTQGKLNTLKEVGYGERYSLRMSPLDTGKLHSTHSTQDLQDLPQTHITELDVMNLPGAPSTPSCSSLTKQPTHFRLSSTGNGAA